MGHWTREVLPWREGLAAPGGDPGARCQALSPQLMQQQAALVAAHSAYLSPMATMAVQMQHMGTVNPNGLIATPLPPSSGRWDLGQGGDGDAGDGVTRRGSAWEGRISGMRTWDMGDTQTWGTSGMSRDGATWRVGSGRWGSHGWGHGSGVEDGDIRMGATGTEMWGCEWDTGAAGEDAGGTRDMGAQGGSGR